MTPTPAALPAPPASLDRISPPVRHDRMRPLRWLRSLLKSPAAGPFPVRHGFADDYGRLRDPSAWELLRELKSTAYTCASINAAVCASFRPKLYVRSDPGQPEPKCPIHPPTLFRIFGSRSRLGYQHRSKCFDW